jgi:DNA replication ATP-dependent helicase Dna2
LLAVDALLDVEEDIWCPKFGLKGKLDATVNTIVEEPNPIFPKAPKRYTGPKPFEIKTGKAFSAMEHRAQTMLYNVIASERYGEDVTSGLLYYTQSEGVVQVPTGWNEIRALIMVRNQMAAYMMKRQKGEEEKFLPPTIDDERTCKRCYTVDTCMLYRKVSSQASK